MSTDLLKKGSRVGGYQIVDLLGEGTFGAVYSARSLLRQDEVVALKVLKREHCSSADMVTRFRNEARAAWAIKHPNVIEIRECQEMEDGTLYLVMELLRGAALDTILRGGRLTQAAAISVCWQCAHALAAAHAKGIIHRDIKPANVYLLEGDTATTPLEQRTVKVLDFGVAQVRLRDPAATMVPATQMGTTFGTPAYMAPEQWKAELSDKSDVYSLGIMLYELLAGHLPFHGADNLQWGVAHNTAPLRPILLWPESPLLATLVHSMLEKAPQARPTMQKVVTVLEEVAKNPMAPVPSAPRPTPGPAQPRQHTNVLLIDARDPLGLYAAQPGARPRTEVLSADASSSPHRLAPLAPEPQASNRSGTLLAGSGAVDPRAGAGVVAAPRLRVLAGVALSLALLLAAVLGRGVYGQQAAPGSQSAGVPPRAGPGAPDTRTADEPPQAAPAPARARRAAPGKSGDGLSRPATGAERARPAPKTPSARTLNDQRLAREKSIEIMPD